MTKALQSRN